MNNFAKGIDISTYQDSSYTPIRIDFSKPKLLGVKFIINRAVFVTAKDDDFDHNWQDEKNHCYIRGAYGFWGYWDGCADVTTQAKTLINILKPDPGEFPIVWLDVEKANSNYPNLPSRNVSLPSIERYMKTVEDGLGMSCGMYTNIAGLMALAPIPTWLMDRPLWISWPLAPNTGETPEDFIFRTGVRPPISKYWTEPFLIWQYSWKGPGLELGTEANHVDMNYFNGTEGELYAFCDSGIVPEEPPVEEEEDMLKMKVTATGLNVRTGPSTNYTSIGTLPNGTVVTVYDVAGVYGSWVKIDPDNQMWCCVQNNYGKYLQKI